MDPDDAKPKNCNSIFDTDRLLGRARPQQPHAQLGPPFAHCSNAHNSFTLINRNLGLGLHPLHLPPFPLPLPLPLPHIHGPLLNFPNGPAAASSRPDGRHKGPRRSRAKGSSNAAPGPIITPIISITPLAAGPMPRREVGDRRETTSESPTVPLSLVTNGRSRNSEGGMTDSMKGADPLVDSRREDSALEAIKEHVAITLSKERLAECSAEAKRPQQRLKQQRKGDRDCRVTASITVTPIAASSPPPSSSSGPLNLSLRAASPSGSLDFRLTPSPAPDSSRGSRPSSSVKDYSEKRQRVDLPAHPVAAHSGSQPASLHPAFGFPYERDRWLVPPLAHLAPQGPTPNLTETLARLASSPYPSPTTVITVSGTGPNKVISVLPGSSSAPGSKPKEEDAVGPIGSRGAWKTAKDLDSRLCNGDLAGGSKGSPLSDTSSDGSYGSDTSGNSDCSSNQDSGSDSESPDSDDAREQSSGTTSSRKRSPGSKKRKRRTVASNESELRITLEHGWRRQTKIRAYSFSGARGEVMYYAPCGKKLKTYPEVVRYLEKHGIADLSRENFSFSAKHNIGEFLDPQEGGRHALIGEHEVLARIEEYRASKGRKYYYYQPAKRKSDKGRKVEEQGATSGERTNRSAADKRRQKEHVRFLKQREKAERQEQMRAEKEMRTQQLLEEKELKRQKAVARREQELQKRRELLMMIDLERERRRQHMVLVKALEVRKKQEERERLKEEKNTEKRLIKEKKLEQKRIELEIIREMKKPVEDMELTDTKALPALRRIGGVKLSAKAFADILMVYEFIHTFGETLGFDMENLPTLNTLQLAMLNDESAEEELVTILHHLLTCAIVDPGMPPGPKSATLLGQSLKNVDITSGTVSEVLRIFIQAHDSPDSPMLKWIVDKPFMALNPTHKSTILAFLCNELLCSRNVCRQIDNSIESVNSLRRDKWVVEGNIRKMRSVQMRKMVRLQNAKANKSSDKTDEKSNGNEGEEDDAKNDSGNESDGSRRTAQGEALEPEEDDEEPGLSPEEIEKKIDRLSKQMNLFRRKLTKAAQQLRALSYGQDRYRRRYWVLPRIGGVLVESMESGEFDPNSFVGPVHPCEPRPDEGTGHRRLPDPYGSRCAKGGEPSVKMKREDAVTLAQRPYPYPEGGEDRGREAFGEAEPPMWFSILPRMPCDETTLTRLMTKDEPRPLQCTAASGSRYELTQDADVSGPLNPAEPIPAEFHRGWWRITDAGQLRSLCQALHSRGIREKYLQKQLEKYLDIACEACGKSAQDELNLEVTEEGEGSEAPEADPVHGWSYETALRVDLAIVEQVEALEERVASASMQIKSWKIPPKITEEDGIKFRPVCVAFEAAEDEEDGGQMIMCPLDVAKERILNLEAAIERRYLKPPLGHSLSLPDTAKTLNSSGGENGHDREPEPEQPEEASPGLVAWRGAVLASKTSSQLALCLSYLENMIAWDRSIMKASCQFCNSGDNEGMLLLCDGCDKGYHTYCFRPKMECIPEGDWFCYECVNKASGDRVCVLCGKKGKGLRNCDGCPKAFHLECMDPPLSRMPKNRWFCWQCGQKNGKNKGKNGNKKTEKGKDNAAEKEDTRKASKEQRVERKNKLAAVKDLAPCRVLLSEMESHEDAWPFLLPVDTKNFPTYRKIIKKPMDLSTIKAKIADGKFKGREEFVRDVRLMFDNCEMFNEDDSPVGGAGHNLRAYFESRWSELSDA